MIDEREIRYVAKVLRGGRLTERGGSGFYVSRFEDRFAKFIGVKHAIAVSSGTAALHAALLAVGLRGRDEVIMPSFTFVASAEATLLAGGKPVFVDINPDTYCVDPEGLEEVISRRVRVIIPTHLYGMPCDMDPILELAREYNAVVVEDAAQAHGAEYKGRKVGSLGSLACFSFYATKSLTTGEGGMVLTDHDEYAELLRRIRSHGDAGNYKSDLVGHNYRMNEIAGAIGLVQLSKLPKFLEARRRNAEVLTDKLKDLNTLQLPIEPDGRKHGWHVYTIRLKRATVGRRDRLVKRLKARGIEAAVYYPTPIHLMPCYTRYAPTKGSLPNTEVASRQVFSLPIHPAISREDIDYIANTLRRLL